MYNIGNVVEGYSESIEGNSVTAKGILEMVRCVSSCNIPQYYDNPGNIDNLKTGTLFIKLHKGENNFTGNFPNIEYPETLWLKGGLKESIGSYAEVSGTIRVRSKVMTCVNLSYLIVNGVKHFFEKGKYSHSEQISNNI